MTSQDILKKSTELLAQLSHMDADQLEQLVRHHNVAYFAQNAPEITDEAFDKLVEALRVARPESPVLDEIGVDIAEGGAANFDAVVHKRPMLSLDKCYDDATFLKWREKIRGPVIAMAKIDGVACSIHYDAHGHLVLSATRGDGKQGENVTANVSRITDVPTQIAKHVLGEDGLEVRGEVHMKLSRFKKHYASQFANPRNLAAGALKQKEMEKSAAYGLSFFPYDIRGAALASEQEKFGLLKELGFSPPHIVVCNDDKDVIEAVRTFAKERETLDYEIDGVVFRADRISEQERLGETAHHPRFAIAYKFQGDSAQTELVDVEWSVARMGVITPVAIVRPVFVSGATVTRASLHNLGMFKELALSKNARVEIVRRGGVIPHVERVLAPGGEPFAVPTACPSCGGPVIEDGDFLRCEHPERCPQVIVSRILHFCAVMDLEGFGDRLVQTLVSTGLVKKPADLYGLQINDLLPLERMGKTLATKLVASVNAKREVTLPVFLTALGIGEIGPTVAATIAQQYPDLHALLQATQGELAHIFGIGESIANALVEGLRLYRDDIEALLDVVKIVREKKIEADPSHVLFGKSVVFTGKMATLERKEAQKKVQQVGGKTPSGVTSSTDYLVVGDEGSPLLGEHAKSTKQKEAEKLVQQGAKIQIITEASFLQML